MTNVRQIIINSPKYGQKICLVDDEDFEMVSKYRWNICFDKNRFYALYSDRNTTIRMHQLILGIKPHKLGRTKSWVDHIDHNGLNNTRDNIRICSPMQNTWNFRIASNNVTGYKGVTIHRNKSCTQYRSRIRVNKKLLCLGLYETPIEAALKYNEAAIKYFGEFAYLNKI